MPGDSLHGAMPELRKELKEHLHDQLKNLLESLERSQVDREKLQIEISHGLEHVHEAIQEAMRHLPDPRRDLPPVIKTMVQSNESGTFVIVANPKRRLTVHDKAGKMIFDGEIETPEQQAKVPADVWEKVKPMLEKMEIGRAH